MEKNQIINELKEQLADGKTTEVLDILRGSSNYEIKNLKINNKTKNEIILISSMYESVQRKQRVGVLSNNEFSIELNRINNSLLKIIQKIESQTLKDENYTNHSLKSILIINLSLLVIILAALFMYNQNWTSTIIDGKQTNPSKESFLDDKENNKPSITDEVEEKSLETINRKNKVIRGDSSFRNKKSNVDTLNGIEKIKLNTVRQEHLENLDNPEENRNEKPQKTYTLSILTKPERAKIFIDEKFKGLSNKEIKLTEGEYKIEVRKDKFEEFVDVLTIPQQSILTIKLKKQ